MKGFAALISVIIIGAIMIVAGMMVTLTSINEGQMSLSNINKFSALTLLDSCTEESLFFINTLDSLPINITTPKGSCTTTTNSHIGTSWDFSVGTTVADYQQTNRIKTNRGTNLQIGSWQVQ